MKKSGFARRALALLLVIVMTLQIVPTGVFALVNQVGDLVTGDLVQENITGIKNNTLSQDDAINWPIKIYDYLDDGMLFEWNDSQDTGYSDGGYHSETGGQPPYGGGATPPATVIGVDFTDSQAYTEAGWKSYGSTGTSYTITAKGAVDYSTPRYINVVKKTAYANSNICVGSWYTDSSYVTTYNLEDIRYMTMVYRGTNISDDKFSVLFGTSWYRTSFTTIADSTDWTYVVLDLNELLGDSADSLPDGIQSMWITWGEYSTTQKSYEGLNDGSSCDITHVGFFSNKDQAENYGAAALAFDNNPGEYLEHSTTISTSGETLAVTKPSNIFSLRYYYNDDGNITGNAANTNWGMDLTHTSTANGIYTTGVTTESYKTWAKGGTVPWPGMSTGEMGVSQMQVSRGETANGVGYTNLSNISSNTGDNRILLSKFLEEDNTSGISKGNVNYIVLVYRTNNFTSDDKCGICLTGFDGSGNGYTLGAVGASSWRSYSSYIPMATLSAANSWNYLVIDLNAAYNGTASGFQSTWNNTLSKIKRIGIFLPALTNGKSLDLAYVSYFSDSGSASSFGTMAAAYMNGQESIFIPGETINFGSSRQWVTGNNKSFGMLFASSGGGWGGRWGGSPTSTTYKNSYYKTWMIGYDTAVLFGDSHNSNRQDIYGNKLDAAYTTTTTKVTQQNVTTGKTNNTYFIYAGSGSGRSDDGNSDNGTAYDTSILDFDGYDLLELITDGLCTVGLLEGSLSDNRLPVYRQETVEYIAYHLHHALTIPQRDGSGNYNLNYITGSTSTQFGGVDLNGDGELGMADLDGDCRNETNENSVDLATALRYELGIKFSMGSDKGTYCSKGIGDYATTAAKGDKLIGTFAKCREYIETPMDAAYFMLNNLFTPNSYNQEQDDYSYLTLNEATLTDGRTAYVFDAGFSTGAGAESVTTEEGEVAYAAGSKPSIQYSPYVTENADGTKTYGSGTISLGSVGSKDKFWFQTGTATTRFPFLPITDSEGEYAGETTPYYFNNDGIRSYLNDLGTYKNRNYNYVLASNGEFVYREEDQLFFEFEGDDDVYLFINGQLVLDIGAGHSITSVGINVNDYVEWARAIKADSTKYNALSEDEQLRVDKLALTDGQICQFDFYYMERHGFGANMRIVTNMHITDPALSVDKNAYQFGEEIEYGGIVDATASAEYQFSLTNTGNTKLYNLTWSDATLGVTLDPTNGLTVGKNTNGTAMNGIYVMDANGGPLEAKDLSAVVKGTNAEGITTETIINFPDKDGDGGQTALKNFLHVLDADGLESGQDDAEVTRSGSGLWVGSVVTIRGIYYMLTPEQINAGVADNTVYLTATTKTSPDKAGNQTLRSDASHRMYTSGFPIHYQWADHNIFMNLNYFLTEAKKEAKVDGSQLSLYDQFFESVTSMDQVYTQLCDKYGRVGGEYPYQTYFTDSSGNNGYLINYDEPGIYTFYLLLYKKVGVDSTGKSKTYAESGVNAADITAGDYAIVRSQVYVADVEDSVYVLDYGLSTESLDIGGELFKNDYLFGPYGTVKAKLMGVSDTQPSYLDPKKVTGSTDYSRIVFESMDLTTGNTVKTDDGIYKVNLPIPDKGKNIAYDSSTGEYTLTGVGTVTVNAEVPIDGNWNAPYLYYWYDDGTKGPSWPGTLMNTSGGAGKFELDIPADVTNVIINNGSGALQTADLAITPGLESTIKVTVDSNNKVSATIENVVGTAKLHAKAPSGWEKVYLHYWRDDKTGTEWPGIELTEKDDAGYYIYDLPSDASFVIINDGSHNQTGDLDIYAGKEVWIEVNDESSSSKANNDNTTTYYFDAFVKYTDETYTVHASVPAAWGDTISLYYWHSGAKADMDWPGITMTKGDFGWYTLSVPADVTNMIVTDGAGHKTADLTVTPGLETWITVNNATEVVKNETVYTTNTAYGSESGSTGLTFTPNKFMDSDDNNLWLALTVHSTSANPTKINTGINVHNEVQMYKKITVVPATVVYYEDDFVGIDYNSDDATSENVFTYHGEGSGRLAQGVDQEQPYGQDATYQDSANDLYSGDHMTAVQIMDNKNVATFTFKGTGFELISRTNAVDSASTVAMVYDATAYAAYIADTTGETAKPTALKVLPMITQFDQNNDGGSEAINQVPTIRITDMTYGTYTVELSGIPTYTFDQNYNISGTKETYLYIDGLRIYQPMGSTHEAYSDAEDGASVNELRDLIATGKVAVATLNDGTLKLSSGTTTWTENLAGGSGATNFGSYEGSKVDSSNDYLIQGPNNEVYMEGSSSKTAVVFYVAETGTGAHELQISVRGLDYAKFYGTGSTAMNAQIQYGVQLEDGSYAWKNLARVVSGTEQYYSIPYAECPEDSQGRYQIVLRAVSGENEIPALLSYTNLKLNGLNVEEVEGVGEATVLYYLNGFLVQPDYYLCGTINGTEYGKTDDAGKLLKFEDGRLSLHLEQDSYITIRRDMAGATLLYQTKGDLGTVTSATMYSEAGDTANKLFVPAGDVTFKLVQTKNDTLTLSYCAHSWNDGEITTEATCTAAGEKTHTCTACGMKKVVPLAMVNHSYADGKCSTCSADEPTRTVYFRNTEGWESVCIWAWNDSQNFTGGTWPGTEMTHVEGDLYSYTLSVNAVNVIFNNNNNGKQTGTLTISDDVVYSNGEYYLRGGMNGWAADENNRMALNEDASYSITMDLAAGTYEYKAAKSDWSGAVPSDANATLTLESAATVTFTLAKDENGAYVLSSCVHSWNAGEVTTEATCTAEGVKTYTCSKCSGTKTEVIAIAAHTYKDDVCTVCQKVKPCTTHTWKITTSAGCVYDGARTYTCTVCGEKKSETIDSVGGHICQVKVINVTTCTTDGKQVLGCDICGYVRIDIIKAVGHNYVDGVCTVCGEAEPCAEHAWGEGVVTTPAGCSTDGVLTYTCSNCGTTKTESIAAGHNYVDGVCTGCGKRDPSLPNTIYFRNSANWATVNVYAWTPGENNTNIEQTGGWPGSAMLPVEGETDLYYYEVPGAATMLIFNNGSGTQTPDQGIPTNGMNLYIWAVRNWATYGVDLEFYLRGNMNGWGTDDKMTLNADGSYTITKELAAGTYEFKAGTFDWRIGFPSENMTMTLDADATVTFTLAVNSSGDMELTYTTETVATVSADPVATAIVAEDYALNLYSISQQLGSDKVIGEMDIVEPDLSDPGYGNDTETDEENQAAPTISMKFPSLELSEEVYYNVFFDVSNPDGVEITEMGMITWTSEIDGTVENAKYVVPGTMTYGDYLIARSQPIPAKNLSDELYFKVYLKLADGSYVYSTMKSYSAKTYVVNKLSSADTSDELKSLCMALMNYGAAAQTYFSYKTDALMNADLTAYQTLAKAYSADMIADVTQADASKITALTANGGYNMRYPAVAFGGAFSISYNFVPANTVDGEMKLYIWDAETYNNLDALTLENATEVKTMKAGDNGMYIGEVTGIAAKDVDSTIYVCGVYESGGVTYNTGVLAYSLGAYCKNKAAGTTSMQPLAAATAVYTYYAKIYLS